ncbi:MAG: amino acid degradation protein, partial [Thermoleophilia bacterium]|nr:amino acid degradation protein [Thermoleophilia bacterium]
MWQTPDQLQALLCQLVAWDTVTGTPGEARFPERLAGLLRRHGAFDVRLGDVDADRAWLTALHRCDGVADTIVLLSHFDTVDTAEYGALEPLAHDPVRLTAAYATGDGDLDGPAADDAASGDYLFGRGVMDMKAGLALHVALLERAQAEAWPINLLLLTVPDEEVDSAGMRAAVDELRRLEVEEGLRYAMFLNGEPSFPAHPGDLRHHVYSGSIGKLLPAALVCGRETHAGTPFAGITSTWMASFLVQAMEWSDAFVETVHGEATPVPVTLGQADLREGYSTQTTSRTSVLCNVFVMERTAAEVMDRFEGVARTAADRCTAAYRQACERSGVAPIGDVRVLRYEELVQEATERIGAAGVEALVADALADAPEDLRAAAMHVADRLLAACPHLAPAMVLLFAPPCYPPVCSSGDALVEACVARLREQADARFGLTVERTHWFNGISDLSYLA